MPPDMPPPYADRFYALSITDLLKQSLRAPSHSKRDHARAPWNAQYKVSVGIISRYLLVFALNLLNFTVAPCSHRLATPRISIASWLATGGSRIRTHRRTCLHPPMVLHKHPTPLRRLRYVLCKYLLTLFLQTDAFPCIQSHPSAASPRLKSTGPPRRL